VVTLRLRRFWRGAEKPGGFFDQLVQRAVGESVRIVTSRRDSADLEIVRAGSSLPRIILARGAARVRTFQGHDDRWADQHVVRPSQRRSVWFTAENLRPPAADDWAGFLSFDTDPLSGRNAYLPLWILDLKDYNESGDLHVADLLRTRYPRPDRTGFVCAFIGNPDPMRFHAIKALGQLGEVHVFGRAVGKPVNNKIAIARGYRYILTFENDLYPGYTTEKCLDGARTGCVPLYRGLAPEWSINAHSMVNCLPEMGVEGLVETVCRLESDREERANILASPVLREAPDTSAAELLIRRVMCE
jgi:hypothetical protein